MRRATAVLAGAAVALAAVLGVVLAGTGSALLGRGSAGAALTITFKGGTSTTTRTVTIAADGTYQADFGIAQVGDYTATIRRSNGTTLATIPIAATAAAEPCITPTAGTGADWGVTPTPSPADPRFPSFVTICGRVAAATTGDSSTPAGSPPSLGTPSSVSRDDAGNTSDGVLHGDLGRNRDDDDGGGFPWLVVAVVVVGAGVVVGLLWQHGRARAAASTPRDRGDTPE